MADYQALNRLIKNLAKIGVKSIRYSGGGDPLLHPNIKELLALPHEYGIKLCLITNGDYLNEKIGALVCEYVDHLRWSVNAAYNSTRLKIHRPEAGVNLLSESFECVSSILKWRRKNRGDHRRPMVWATYMITKQNIDEMIDAVNKLRTLGVDSVSFRRVNHGLDGSWTKQQLINLDYKYILLKKVSDPPHFLVFTPRRSVADSLSLATRNNFEHCLSRRTSTIFEATSKGLTNQYCGMYRGTGADDYFIINNGDEFDSTWQKASKQFPPKDESADCCQCINSSANLTLKFILNILSTTPDAEFHRVLLDV